MAGKYKEFRYDDVNKITLRKVIASSREHYTVMNGDKMLCGSNFHDIICGVQVQNEAQNDWRTAVRINNTTAIRGAEVGGKHATKEEALNTMLEEVKSVLRVAIKIGRDKRVWQY